MKKNLLMALAALLLTSYAAQAQEETTPARDYTRGWYVGAQVGMPMAEADFSSFGADGFRAGWNAGLHLGYRFTPIWSLEMTGNWGEQFLSEQACCNERGYFLGTDHNRYRYYIPNGMEGWNYSDLKSRTFVQRYGLQVNMNILGFFNKTKDSRWHLELSPAVYLAGTRSNITTKGDNSPVASNLREWHLGYGGQAQVSYAITKNMRLGIYGGFTHLTGDPMDGMPELHTTNYIIDAGFKFSFSFGAKHKRKSTDKIQNIEYIAHSDAANYHFEQSEEYSISRSEPEPAADSDVVEATEQSEESPISRLETEPTVESEVVETFEQDTATESVVAEAEFPVIYFSFNSNWIEPDEKIKIKQIADMMKAAPTIRIRITGWSDNVGGEEACKRVSLQRAEAVKVMLGKWLISADRIETAGAGIAHDAPSREEARNATTIEIINE